MRQNVFLSDEYRQTDGYPRRQIPEGKIDKDTKYPGSYNFWLEIIRGRKLICRISL